MDKKVLGVESRPAVDDWKDVEPLDMVTCSSSDCEKDLHCFRNRRPRLGTYRSESCNSCGKSLIDWDRIDRHNLTDVNYTIGALEREYVRHHYWHRRIDEQAITRAKRFGMNEIRNWAKNRLEHYVNKISSQNPWDGRQTPKSGNIVFYAQHATACCCRKCMEEWHGIDRNRLLTEDEMEYFTELIMLFSKYRLPNIPVIGEKSRSSRITRTN